MFLGFLTAAAMQKLQQLESLNLSWNKCVGENLRQFLEPLPSDCKLQELRLSSCNLTTEDLLHLGQIQRVFNYNIFDILQ